MKVLCICPIGIGNYLMVYPACHAIKRYRPDLSMHLLALRTPIRVLAEGDTLWDEVFTIDPTRQRGIFEQLAFINGLRPQNYGAALSFFPANKWQYNLLPLLAGVTERFAFRYPLKRLESLSFLSNRPFPMVESLHDVAQNMHIAAFFLERDIDLTELVFPQLFGDKEISAAQQHAKAIDAPPIRIAVHAGSSNDHGMDAKRWAPERFGLLADRICGKLGAGALVFGGSDETDLKRIVKANMQRPCYEVEQLDLRTTAALISTCTLMLCNDSGLMHMAACAGVPTAAVFGPTDERRNGPVGKNHLVIRKRMHGFPLWTARTVGDRAVAKGVDPMAPLKALSVDDAWSQIEPWLDRLPGVSPSKG